jgi:hypothetical protein
VYIEREEDLSVYYLITNLFTDVAGLKVVDDYPVDNLIIPSIAVVAGKIRLEDFELGNRVGRRYRKWMIEVYAKNKSQRDEYGYRILNGFTNGITVYDYDLGFPPVVVPKAEHLDVVQREMDIIRIMPELVDKMYYRATITISAVNDTV